MQVEVLLGAGLVSSAVLLIVTAPSTAGTCGIEIMRTANNTLCTGASLWRFTAILTTTFLGSVILVVAAVEWIYASTPPREKTWSYLDPGTNPNESILDRDRTTYTSNKIPNESDETDAQSDRNVTEEESTTQSSDSRR